MGLLAARLIAGLIVVATRASERQLLIWLVVLCVLALLVWQVWWWRARRR